MRDKILGPHRLSSERQRMLLSILSVCAMFSIVEVRTAAAEVLLADPVSMLRSAERRNFVGANKFAVEDCPVGQCLRSTPLRSASALYQRVAIDGGDLQHVHWTWRVDRLQNSADIRNIKNEDFGAMVMFVFGEPSLFNRDVPTLCYVWTTTPVPNGSVLASVRYAALRNIQLRGRSDVGRWQRETRNVVEDFTAIFGRSPPPLRYIAIFNDNDQTGEETSALFGAIVSGR